MLKSAIDLGTNTCLLLIADWDAGRSQVGKVRSDHSTIVRLGQGVDKSRQLSPEATERTLACLRRYSEYVRQAGLDPKTTICVATSQARDAKNGAEFFAHVEKETGFKFRTISGDDEAKYSFRGGLLPGMDPSKSAVIDIGGGSTELMSAQGGVSIDLGSVRYTERFFKTDPVQDEQFWACEEDIDEAFLKQTAWRKSLAKDVQLVAVAGTATTLAAYHMNMRTFDAEAIDQITLTRGDLHRMVEELKWRSIAERKELPGIEEGRADVILAGALILWRALEKLDFKEVRVSTRGLRYGVLGL
jgi:exopolyphosphatase/guanosine-5'-triphosphate,3'-diphosphate pyrophosphatase